MPLENAVQRTACARLQMHERWRGEEGERRREGCVHRQGVCKEQAARTCLLGNGTAVCNRTAATVLASGTHARCAAAGETSPRTLGEQSRVTLVLFRAPGASWQLSYAGPSLGLSPPQRQELATRFVQQGTSKLLKLGLCRAHGFSEYEHLRLVAREESVAAFAREMPLAPTTGRQEGHC